MTSPGHSFQPGEKTMSSKLLAASCCASLVCLLASAIPQDPPPYGTGQTEPVGDEPPLDTGEGNPMAGAEEGYCCQPIGQKAPPYTNVQGNCWTGNSHANPTCTASDVVGRITGAVCVDTEDLNKVCKHETRTWTGVIKWDCKRHWSWASAIGILVTGDIDYVVYYCQWEQDGTTTKTTDQHCTVVAGHSSGC